MKKFLFLASAAALALVSCSDDLGLKNENTPAVEGTSKVIATFPIGNEDATRTQLNEKYQYVWQAGDAVGLFNADTDDATNALFAFNGVENEFVGNLNMLEGEGYYAYYPWAPNTVLTESEIPVQILANQNFNPNVDNVQTSYYARANGSFASGAAPAVAFANAAQDNLVGFTFKPAAGYVVFPVKGNGTKVTSVTLSIKKANDEGQLVPVQLNGTMNVDMTAVAAGVLSSDDVTWKENLGEYAEANANYYSITLNCGKGVDLNLENATNFWFVVPGFTPVNGAEISLVVNGDKEHPITKTVNAPSYPEVGLNQVVYLWDGIETPFFYNPDGKYMIQTAAQFIEYAYAATNQVNALVNWSKNVKNYNYSDLQNMINLNGKTLTQGNTGATPEDFSGTTLKPALIANNINFADGSVAKLLGTNPSQYGTYYSDVYGTFLAGEGIPQIGSANGYTTVISGGSGEEGAFVATLSNLKVNGNGMFNGGYEKTKVTVENIVLSNIEVNASDVVASQYYFLSDVFTKGVVYDNVTIDNKCQVTPPAENENPVAVLGSVWTKWFDPEAITNQTTLPYANTLNVNYDFDFTAGYGIDEFNTIKLVDRTFGMILTVENESDAIYLVDNVQIVLKTWGYSIVDKSNTSYWTGTNYYTTSDGVRSEANSKVVTAEQLAWVVQNNSANVVTLTNNLNLMGNYTNSEGKELNMKWFAKNGDNVVTVNGTTAGNTISNIFIDGTGLSMLTTLGNQSKVSNVTFKDIHLNVTAANQIVAGVSNSATGSTNVSVNGFYPTFASATLATAYNNTFGGLYAALLSGNLKNITNWNLENAYPAPDGYRQVPGNLAGLLSVTVKSYKSASPDVFTCPAPVKANGKPFGKVNISVEYTSGQQSYYVSLQNFTDMTTSDLTAVITDGEEDMDGTSLYVTIGTTQYIGTYTWNTSTKSGAFTNWRKVG